MVNQRNVDALTPLMRELRKMEEVSLLTPKDRAEWLAAQGVLVPSALRYEDCVSLGVDMPEWQDGVTPIRERLERIAKGEA